MEISISRDNLIKAIRTVINAKPTKTTNSILEGMLIQTNKGSLDNLDHDKIKVTVQESNIGIESTVECSVIEEGATVVDASLFSEIINKLPNSEINIKTLNENLVQITCEGSNFKLNAMNVNEYPELPNIDLNNSYNITIDQNVLKNMIKKTHFAVSTDEARPIYTGALFEIKDNFLNIVAIDGFRMAIRSYKLEKDYNDFSVIIRDRTLKEVIKILDDSSLPIRFGVSDNQAVFELDNCKIVTKIIDGKFLEYKNSIPKMCKTKIKVNRQNLIDSFERVKLMKASSLDKENNKSVKLEIDVNKIVLSCNNQYGDAKEEVYIDFEGQSLVAGFNPTFFIEALRAIDDEEVEIEFTSEIAPSVIRSKQNDEYLYLVLPIRLQDNV